MPKRASKPTLLLVPGAVALLAGLWAGLVRLGGGLPVTAVASPAAHGPLMVGGFLGTLIGLERAIGVVSLGHRRWPYLVPIICGLGALALAVGAPPVAARVLILLGSVGLLVLFGVLCALQWNAAHITMAISAACWIVGNLLWLAGALLVHAVAWWAGFLILMIAGERLELSRVVLTGSTAWATFAAAATLFLAGLALSQLDFTLGLRVAGAGLAALGLWLLLFDLARRTIRHRGQTRFIAACLLPGYAWLVAAGALWIAAAPRFFGGPLYDAMLHAIFLGFVFSMIFGHAPIILPAVTGLRVGYHPRFYAHLGLLHLSLALRVAGDLGGWIGLRHAGGTLGVLAILLFVGSTLFAVAEAAGDTGRKPVAAPPRSG